MKLAWFVAQIALVALVQIVTTAIVAGWVRRLGWAHGLFAMFVSGCMMTVALLGVSSVFSDSGYPEGAWMICNIVLSGGALVSLPIALGIATLATWLRGAGMGLWQNQRT